MLCADPLRRVPHAAADELDELTLEVTPDAPASSGEGGDAPPSEQQRATARAAVASLQPLLEPLLQQLVERCRDK